MVSYKLLIVRNRKIKLLPTMHTYIVGPLFFKEYLNSGHIFHESAKSCFHDTLIFHTQKVSIKYSILC